MRPTPFGPLFARGLRARCPICGNGPLFAGLFALRSYCPLCGFRYARAREYGAQGYMAGVISLNIMITGAVALGWLVYVAASGLTVPLLTRYLIVAAWAIIFPIFFHRVACAVWIALDLRLNPPAEHELAAAPPRSTPTPPPANHQPHG